MSPTKHETEFALQTGILEPQTYSRLGTQYRHILAVYLTMFYILGNFAAVPYTVRVVTGPDKNMGTSGPLWIRILGRKESKHTGRQYLELMQKDGFEPGSVETFSFEAPDVGAVCAIEVSVAVTQRPSAFSANPHVSLPCAQVGNDAVTPGSGWYVKEITIDMPTKGKSTHFSCKTWLARDKLDSKTTRIFTVKDGDSSSVRSYKPSACP